MLKKISLIVFLLCLSYLTWKPLVKQGFFAIHDNQQIVRLQQLDKALSFGQFPVRWVSDLGFGFGYPLFNFYPPLTYYLGEIYHLVIKTNFIDSIKLVWFTALMGSAATMYFFSKKFFGKVGGLVSAIFYLYAPYHAVDAYVRGALAELFSFVWLPLILLFSYKAVTEKSFGNAIFTGLFLGLLMLAHNLIFLPFFSLFTVWWFGWGLLNEKKNFVFVASSYLIACVFGFGLSAFFWLPSLWEKQYTLVDFLLTVGPASYRLHFVCLDQLWNSLWGFGGSVAGCIDGLSFKIGKPHIILAILSLVVLLKTRLKLFSILLFLLLGSVFMTTDYSRFFWEKIPPLWYLQFPWRFLEFVVLFSSFVVGGLFLVIKNRKIKFLLAFIAIIIVIVIHGKYFSPSTYFLSTTDEAETSERQIKWIVSGTSFEYLPKEIATRRLNNGAIWVDINENDVPNAKYSILEGAPSIKGVFFTTDKFWFKSLATTSSLIRFNIVNFPGWKVLVDGVETAISDDNKFRLITVRIGPGDHEIKGEFTNTQVRLIGNLISLVSILAVGICFYGFRKAKK